MAECATIIVGVNGNTNPLVSLKGFNSGDDLKLATFGTLNLTRQSLAVGLLNSTLPSADARGLPSIGKFLERLFLANPSTLTKSEISCAALCTPAANADAPSVTPF